MADETVDLERIPPPPTAAPLDIVAPDLANDIAREGARLRPYYPQGTGYGYGYGGGDGKIHLRELWRTLRKRKWLILTLMFVVTSLVTIEMYRTKNIYQAATLIEIGK